MAKNKSDKAANESLNLETLIDDEKMLDRLCQFVIEYKTRNKNLDTSKRELKECTDKFKEELGLTKTAFEEVLEYAKSQLVNEPKEQLATDRIEMVSKLGRRIVEKAESNKQLKNALV